jgi:hypothetical protein
MIRRQDIFGKGPVPAVLITGNSQNHPVIAEVHLPPLAIKTMAAIDGGIKSNPVSGPEAPYCRAGFNYFARRFVAHNNGRFPPPRGAVKSMNIGTADCRRLYPDQHVMGSGDFGIRDIGKKQLFVFPHY